MPDKHCLGLYNPQGLILTKCKDLRDLEGNAHHQRHTSEN
jgi:hypothetical protein